MVPILFLEKKFKECEKGDDITPFDGNCTLIKVDWLAACTALGLACCLHCTESGWRCIDRFPPALAYIQQSSSQREARANT